MTIWAKLVLFRLTRLLFSLTGMACMVAGIPCWLTLCADLLIEGNGYKAQQTPKDPKMYSVH